MLWGSPTAARAAAVHAAAALLHDHDHLQDDGQQHVLLQ
jgi:hypothetical protein